MSLESPKILSLPNVPLEYSDTVLSKKLVVPVMD